LSDADEAPREFVVRRRRAATAVAFSPPKSGGGVRRQNSEKSRPAPRMAENPTGIDAIAKYWMDVGRFGSGASGRVAWVSVRFAKRIGQRGSLTLPSDVRTALNLEEGDIVEMEIVSIVRRNVALAQPITPQAVFDEARRLPEPDPHAANQNPKPKVIL
jgi:bifunctional DNA-binding transcriptional regulator/antitoxin component of YhaV-PrlF toxin-antitoxin module